MTLRTWTNAALLVVTLGFVAWAARFIDATSLVALDGRRYFALFDDAMISMRYAWNFAHGHGLVWNPGEPVEGYTNLLMVLVMAIPNALVEQRLAVLSVQVFGVATLLGIAALTGQIAVLLVPDASPRARAATRLAGFAVPLLYYPLAYWSLLGMETGLLALLLLDGYGRVRALFIVRRVGPLDAEIVSHALDFPQVQGCGRRRRGRLRQVAVEERLELGGRGIAQRLAQHVLHVLGEQHQEGVGLLRRGQGVGPRQPGLLEPFVVLRGLFLRVGGVPCREKRLPHGG